MIGSALEVFDEYKMKSITVKQYCYTEEQNGSNRAQMEDKHFIDDNILNDSSVGFFSVFDGHGGKDVVTHCANFIPELFKQQYQKKCDIKHLFQNIFIQIDEQLEKVIKSAEDQGTCCCIAIIDGRKCSVINLGDTRAVLCENGKARRISQDHKTKEESEIKRINDAGGLILRGRVSGTLAVTRALGDLALKSEGVINEPDVCEFEINEKTTQLIIASDGLWDVCEDDEAIELTKGMQSSLQQSRFLTEYALKKGSLDNTSVLVIWL